MDPELIKAASGLVLSLAAFVYALVRAYNSRFSELRKELAEVRAELNAEKTARMAAEAKATDAEARAELAEGQVAALIEVNTAMRKRIEAQGEELALMRSALVGTEAERNEARRELARRIDDEARKRAAGATEETAPQKAQKDKP